MTPTANPSMIAPWGDRRLERALVYGLKLSGVSALRFLRRRGVAAIGVDRKSAADLDLGELASDPGVDLRLGEAATAPDAPLPDGLDAVVVSPGVPMDQPLLEKARAAGIPVIAEVELAFPALEAEGASLVAITGSNGKSTVTRMVGAILAAAGRRVEVCGNIGTPLTRSVDEPSVGAPEGTEPGRAFVVEMSSFQIEGIDRFRPDAAALLNISEDHLDRYPSLVAYADAKKRLFARMSPEGIAVLNADDPMTLGVRTAARRRTFSRLGPVSDGCFLGADGWVVEVEPDGRRTPLFEASSVPLAGVQNVENAMAAALLSRALGAGVAAIREAIAAFRGLPHRLERIGERDGIAWYDDSKGTNPAATMKSIEGFADGTVHLILGGRNKGADLSLLAPVVAAKARRVYLIGESAEELARALEGTAPIEAAGTLDRAVEAAAGHARPGEVVVLSPACASFDQFKNFEHRGQVFQELVRGRVLTAPATSTSGGTA